jgi:N-acetylmuramoyl-L-alanine amidase
MRTRIALAAALTLLLTGSNSFGADKPEFRAAWVTRFEWATPDPAQCKANITRAMDTLAAANFNAVVFQVRAAADTLYPSTLEPWSQHVGGKDPGFDPLAFAIQEARRNHLAFHAYINAMPMLEERQLGRQLDPNHLFNKHGPESPESWSVVDEQGQPCRSEYVWMSAGIPAVPAYVREVIMDVVRRYDVDGIHLDRIRYPGRQYSYDAISRARFMGRGNPNLQDWGDWQRDQLDKLINDLAAEIRAEKPQVMLSCSAWGIYNRYNIEGYAGFSSGYHDFYQDTWAWCHLGAMDVLMPMIYWNIPEPKPNYDELVRDFIKGVGGDHVVGGQRMFSGEENVNEIKVTREAGGLGTILFSLRSAERRGVLEAAHKELYAEKVEVPKLARVEKPETGAILGTVLAEDGKPLVDAWVTLDPKGSGGVVVDQRRRRDSATTVGPLARLNWTSGGDGRFAFMNVPPGPLQVTAKYEGAPAVASETLEIKAGQVARVQLTVKGAAELRDKPYLTVMRPHDGAATSEPVVHLLGRTLPKAKVTVNGQAVDVFGTGAFAKDDIPLQMGANRIEIAAAEGDRSINRAITITRVAPPATATAPAEKPLRILEPAADVALMPGELLDIRIEGSTGRTGQASVLDSKLPLAEVMDKDGKPSGVYTATTRVPAAATGRNSHVKASLDAAKDSPAAEVESSATVEVWDPAIVRVFETTSDDTGILPGLHEVRLGGPWLGWVAKGTRLEVVGKRGDMYQVRLSPSVVGWVSHRQLQSLPPGTPVPHAYSTSCSISGNETEDTLAIERNAPVAITVRAEIDPSNRLYVDMYNTHDAMTWISQKSTAQILGPVQAEQVEKDHVRLTVPVKGKQIWGYWTEVKGGLFVLHVRHAPKLVAAPDSPLKGLIIAVEAGHGGGNNVGAMGIVGTKEKTVNLQAAMALQHELEARGAKVVQVRRGDENPGLSERAARANEANADFLVCLHANSAGTARGFLKTSGTSTYYHGIHCRLSADLVYRKLLELGWGEFGVVGNFSYTPLRNTRVPALLVEQGFMSNPADEARLVDPEYQKKQATAIASGMEEFLNRVRE